MGRPAWLSNNSLPSGTPPADGMHDDGQASLIDADPEAAQEKLLLSTRSSFSDFGSEGELLHSRYGSGLRDRVLRVTYTFRYLPRSLLVCIVVVTTLLLALGLTTTTHLRSQLYNLGTSSTGSGQSTSVLSNGHAEPGVWPAALGDGGTTKLCDICDCTAQPGIYAPKPEASRYDPRPSSKALFLAQDEVDLDGYMRQAILDIYCERQHMTTSESTRLVRRTASHLDQMVSWNVTGLELDKPTIYLTTNTSPNGKANELRPQYFRRHARALVDWEAGQRAANASAAWQVLWVIVEDELDIDPEVVRTLRRIGVPHVYFAYGPTNGLGHAQRNAAMQLIHAATRPRARGGLLGHGPVYCLDDDNKMEPELLGLLARLDRIGVFPVGNFGVVGGYEKPIVSPIGEVMGSNSPWPNRTYPFDNAGFAFNSSLLGTQISGPTFWKWQAYGGESEFIAQVVSDVRQLEPLCGPDEAQDCHIAWHNEPLAQIEALTDREEDAFVAQFGWDEWRATREHQLRERTIMRGY